MREKSGTMVFRAASVVVVVLIIAAAVMVGCDKGIGPTPLPTVVEFTVGEEQTVFEIELDGTNLGRITPDSSISKEVKAGEHSYVAYNPATQCTSAATQISVQAERKNIETIGGSGHEPTWEICPETVLFSDTRAVCNNSGQYIRFYTDRKVYGYNGHTQRLVLWAKKKVLNSAFWVWADCNVDTPGGILGNMFDCTTLTSDALSWNDSWANLSYSCFPVYGTYIAFFRLYDKCVVGSYNDSYIGQSDAMQITLSAAAPGESPIVSVSPLTEAEQVRFYDELKSDKVMEQLPYETDRVVSASSSDYLDYYEGVESDDVARYEAESELR